MDRAVGTIGILTSEQGRFSRFWASLMGLASPGPTHVITKFSLNIAEARNQVLREAKGEWVWFLDDDQLFRPDLLINLLAHNVDIVQPVVLMRYYPFPPVHMGAETEDGKKHWRFALMQDDPRGLKEVEVVGCSGMLIRRRVWEAMDFPWFTMGQINPEGISEDLVFCRAARAKGFRVYCDLANPMGHMNVGTVWPKRLEDGSWVTQLDFGEASLALPAAEPNYKVEDDGSVYNRHGDRVGSARRDHPARGLAPEDLA